MLSLIQYRPSDPIELGRETLADLLAHSGDDAAALSIEPAVDGKYRVRAGKKVGLFRAAGLDLVIRPKIPTASVVWMLEYAYPTAGFGELLPLLGEEPDVADAVAHLFCQRVAELVKRGLYREYVEREENLRYLRGRPLFLLNETLNHGLRHRTYARHTELTADVWVNRVLLLALTAISRIGPASSATSNLLRWDIAHFSEVSVNYAASSAARSLNRLSAHYAPTLVIAQFILRCVSFALKEGVSLAPRFLIDMNDLFQSYVETVIEREARRSAYAASRPTACFSTNRAVSGSALTSCWHRPSLVS